MKSSITNINTFLYKSYKSHFLDLSCAAGNNALSTDRWRKKEQI